MWYVVKVQIFFRFPLYVFIRSDKEIFELIDEKPLRAMGIAVVGGELNFLKVM